jgi:uracil-DNA glycosylase family 4
LPLPLLQQEILDCNLCPRLRAHCIAVARGKRKAYRDQDYWGKPVPSFGDPGARLLIVGLAPGAHGANRTGRMFTGDRSGDFLFQALHETGFASQALAQDRNDGLRLRDAWITAAAHCAPPDNKPSIEELNTCNAYLRREIALLSDVRVVVCLGRIALEWYLRAKGLERRSRFAFGHGAEFDESPRILCSYHPSQQNTQTGRLTREMLRGVFARAREILA